MTGSADSSRPPVVFVMGPTAAGKTALAVALAERFPVDLVSADSTLVYRGLDIGSAKPDAALLRRHPHALIDVRDLHETYSAADFARDAERVIEASHARGRVPVVVGGTGLYFRALERGLSPLPQSNAELRAEIARDAEQQGWTALHERLRLLDPLAASRINPNDAQRVSRALEVIAITGRPISTQQQGPCARRPWRILKLALTRWPRVELHRRIALRLESMWREGLLEEVGALQTRSGFDRSLPSLRAVGYRQTLEHLAGDYDLDECRQRVLHATRQLAKRQSTWLRSEYDAIPTDAVDPTQTLQRLTAFLP